MSHKAVQSVCWTVKYPRQTYDSILGKQETAKSLIFLPFYPTKNSHWEKNHMEIEEIFAQVLSQITHCHKQSCWVKKGEAGIKL